MSEGHEVGGWIGRSAARVEDHVLLRGGARFLDDIVMPDLAEATFVRSPLAQIAVEIGGHGRSRHHRLSPGRVRLNRTDAAASRSRSA